MSRHVPNRRAAPAFHVPTDPARNRRLTGQPRISAATGWFDPSAGIGAALVILGLVAGGATGAPAIRLLEEGTDGIPGPASAGRPGDLLLENRLVRVVVSRLDHPLGSAVSGGRIIDAAPAGGEDFWGQAILMLTDEYPRQVRYLDMELIPPGERGGRVGVRFLGADNRVDDIEIETEYLIGPGEPFLTIRTTYRWRLRRTLEEAITADRIEIGRTTPFLTYHGFLRKGEPEGLDSTWSGEALFFIGDRVAYAWQSPKGSGITPLRDGGLRIRMKPFRVPGRGEKILERRLYISAGDAASLLPLLASAPLSPVRGVVTGRRRGEPLPGLPVEIRDPLGLLTVAVTGRDGSFEALLPPGTGYRARPVHLSGGEGRTVRFGVGLGDPADLDLSIEEEGMVRFSIVDGGGNPLPGRVLIRDARGRPIGGKRGRPVPEEAVFSEEGAGEISLTPGEYRLFASHGIEYSIDDWEVDIRGGERVEIEFRLRREVDCRTLSSADLEVRTVVSLDGEGVTARERAVEALAEDLDLIVIADRGRVLDPSPPWRTGGPLLVPGEEVVLRDLGRFGLFPLTLAEEIPPRGGHGAEGKAPSRLFDLFRSRGREALIQVCAPREPGFGYLRSMGVDPVTGLTTNIEFDVGFDLLEVANGRALERAPLVLADWFHLLNLGHRIIATGNSASRTSFPGGVGIPRNYVETGSGEGGATVGEVIDGLRAGRSFFTTGPLVRFRVRGGGGPGDLIKETGGLVEIVVEAEAAGWIGLNDIRVFGNGAVVIEKSLGGGSGPYEARETVAIYTDTWFVAVVSGDGDLAPIYSGPDGEPIRPVAVSNPIWVDYNGDGVFNAPGVR